MKTFRNRDIWQTAKNGNGSIESLEKFRKPLIHYLTNGLIEQDKWVWYLAAEMLGTLRDPEAVGHLIPLLADSDEDVRAGAAGALDEIGHPRQSFTKLQQNGCDTCLIRIIAQEALLARRTGEQGVMTQAPPLDHETGDAAMGSARCGLAQSVRSDREPS